MLKLRLGFAAIFLMANLNHISAAEGPLIDRIIDSITLQKNTIWKSLIFIGGDPHYPITNLKKGADGQWLLGKRIIAKKNEPIIPFWNDRVIGADNQFKGERAPAKKSPFGDNNEKEDLEYASGSTYISTPYHFTDTAKNSWGSVNSNRQFESSPSSKESFTYIAGVVDTIEDISPNNTGIVFNDKNLAPIAADDFLSTPISTALIIDIATQVIANDSDPEGEILQFNQVNLTTKLGGSIIDNGDETITYTPPIGITDLDNFEYKISDGNNISSAQIFITIYDPASLPTLEESQTGVAITSLNVSTSAALTMGTNNLYIAMIAHPDSTNYVDDVQGLGLTWNHLQSQCSNTESTSLEIWFAIGVPAIPEVVTATFDSIAPNAQISVARYSNVDSGNPIELLQTSNPLGIAASATCGNPAITSKDISFSVTTPQSNGIILSAISYSLINTFATVNSTLISDIASGANPNATGLIVQRIDAPTITNYTVDGKLQSSTQWSSIAVLINSAP